MQEYKRYKTRDELFATLIHEFAHVSVGQQEFLREEHGPRFRKAGSALLKVIKEKSHLLPPEFQQIKLGMDIFKAKNKC